ncbi:hypothetical protein RYX36_006778 [Vicia faba]
MTVGLQLRTRLLSSSCKGRRCFSTSPPSSIMKAPLRLVIAFAFSDITTTMAPNLERFPSVIEAVPSDCLLISVVLLFQRTILFVISSLSFPISTPHQFVK